MNVRLTYSSGTEFSQHFSNFKARVTLAGGGKRVHVTFRMKEGDGRGNASFTLPYKKARQLAHAILAASHGDADPIEFSVEDSLVKTVAKPDANR